MKRYAMGFFQGAPAMFEQPDGDYVRWSEVQSRKPDLSGCEVMKDGEGVSLESGKPFGFTCCDCGLTHRCVIVSGDGEPVGFAIERAPFDKLLDSLTQELIEAPDAQFTDGVAASEQTYYCPECGVMEENWHLSSCSHPRGLVCRPAGVAPTGEARPLWDANNPRDGYVSDAEWADRKARAAGVDVPAPARQSSNQRDEKE